MFTPHYRLKGAQNPLKLSVKRGTYTCITDHVMKTASIYRPLACSSSGSHILKTHTTRTKIEGVSGLTGNPGVVPGGVRGRAIFTRGLSVCASVCRSRRDQLPAHLPAAIRYFSARATSGSWSPERGAWRRAITSFRLGGGTVCPHLERDTRSATRERHAPDDGTCRSLGCAVLPRPARGIS